MHKVLGTGRLAQNRRMDRGGIRHLSGTTKAAARVEIGTRG
jgi:hypothetical protein